MPVYVGMRNWHPFVAQALQQMQADGIGHAVVICLAPHNSRTSVGLYRKSLAQSTDPEMTFDFVEAWHDQPQLIQAFAEKLTAGLNRAQREFGQTTAGDLHCAQRSRAHRAGRRSLRNPGTTNRGTGGRSCGPRRERLELCFPKPGHVRRAVARSDRGRHDHSPEAKRTAAKCSFSRSVFSAITSKFFTTSTLPSPSLLKKKACGCRERSR